MKGVEVYWVFREEVRIYRDGVLCELYYHDRRHGGDGYSRLTNLQHLSWANLANKIRDALDPDNHWYQLREVSSCR